MARFMIHWCAPDPTNVKYTQAIVDYIKGGKPMDEYAGFKAVSYTHLTLPTILLV